MVRDSIDTNGVVMAVMIMKAYRVHCIGLYSIVQQQRNDVVVTVTCRHEESSLAVL
jgi:hypothetical protein